MNLSKKITAGKLDLIFILPALASLTMVADRSKAKADVLSISPIMQAIILTIATIVIGSFAILGSNIDRRCAEDYTYQLISNAGLIAVITSIMVNMIWLLSMPIFNLSDLTGQNMTGVTMLSWVLGYYWLRFRGVNA